jgi:glycosyltransferase involved in cell wall biosynthesis
MKPTVSVIMPVGEVRFFLREAVRSVLRQTLPDWELVLVDDRPEQDTLHQEISAYGDPRIRILPVSGSPGVAALRNRGVAESRGEFIAFLDADDFCAPQRLQVQMATLVRHPEAALCLGYAWKVDALGRKRRWYGVPNVMRPPRDPDCLAASLLFRNTVCLSSVMVRSRVIREHRFDESYRLSSDYELWTRILADHACRVVPGVLVFYREHEANISRKHLEERRAADRRIQQTVLARLDLRWTEEAVDFAQSMHSGMLPLDPPHVERYAGMMCAVREANTRRRVYRDAGLIAAIARQWRATCIARTGMEGMGAYATYLRYADAFCMSRSLRMDGGLFVKALLRWGER